LEFLNNLGYTHASPRPFKNTSHIKVNFRSLYFILRNNKF
jgi:hypothetical protein